MSVCLNMIVRDEAMVIERCLASVRPYVDRWLIVDTGSTDDTMHRVESAMKGIPGELVERPWRDFGHNRSEALDLARGRADHLLFIDADETLAGQSAAKWPSLDGAAYSIEARYGELRYDRLSVVSTKLPWRWEGVLHEYLDAGTELAQPRIPGFWIDVKPEGARSRDPHKFEKDAALLELVVRRDPANARNVFYLAQSYRDAGNPTAAREWYRKRASMGGWDEDVWYAKYQIACMAEKLGEPAEAVVSAYLHAYESRPCRAEPFVALARFFRLRGDSNSALLFARTAAAMAAPNDRLFLDAAVYGWRAREELALALYYSGNKAEAANVWRGLLAGGDLPASERPRVQENLRFT